MIPEPGTPHFLPRLLEYIESVRPGWSFSPTGGLADVLAALLLVRIVHCGGLLLDVKPSGKDDDLFRVGAVVRALCSDLFGLRTAHLHLDQSSEPSDLSARMMYHSRRPSYPSANPNERPPSCLSVPDQARSRPRSRANTILSAKSAKSGRSGRTEQSVYISARQSAVSISLGGDTPSVLRDNVSQSDGHGETFDDEDAHHTLASALIVTGLEDTNSPSTIKLVDILTSRKVRLGAQDHALPSDFTLIWVRDQNTKCGPGWLVDQFAYSLATSAALLPSPPQSSFAPGDSPIPPDYIHHLRQLLPYTHIRPPLEIHLSNLASAINSHPRLASTLTARFAHLLPQFARAHRLLSRPFSLPRGWRTVLDDPGECAERDRFSLGGGRGGVYTWGREAGEQPSLLELAAMAKRHASGQHHDDSTKADGGGATEGVELKEEPLEDWYALPRDVAGVFEGCVAHRVEWRDDGQDIMWLLKGGAERLVNHSSSSGGLPAGQGSGLEVDIEREMQGRKTPRHKRRRVERILRDILATV